MSTIILITGDRNWHDYGMILKVLSRFKGNEEVLLIHGDCRGADKLSAKAAQELKFKVETYPADWKVYGNVAGPIRNTAMVNRAASLQKGGSKVYVIAFHDDLDSSRGTKHCVAEAKKKGLPVELHSHEPGSLYR